MDMIERYVYDVGRRLPAKQREDIEKELKSLLLDALEARAGGKEPAQEDVAAVLREFGSPMDVAAKYAGERYVIGPRLYPVYRMVLLIVLCAVTFGLAVSFIIGTTLEAQTTADLVGRIAQFFAGVFSSLLGAVGGVTVVFWVIERAMERGGGKPGFEMKWDPKNLPPVPTRRDDWRPSHSVVALVFSAVFLVILNFLPEAIAVYARDAAGQLHRYPVLSAEALAAYLPLWDAGLALSMLLHVALLIRGRWSLTTNLGNIALQVFNIAVVGIMMAGPVLLNTDIVVLGDAPLSATLHDVMPILAMCLRWVFVVAIVGMAIDIGKSVYRIMRDARG
jgi:hypothetical protein